MKHLVSIAALAAAACSSSSNNSPDAGTLLDAAPAACSAARAQLIGAVNTTSTGTVNILNSTAGVTTLYVDASAGGIASQTASPWIFINLGSHAKVSVSDTTAMASTGWDLALKRPVLYTNSGDGGPGQGGAVLIQKDFTAVAAADATGATIATEVFFDAQCNPMTDLTGAPLTTLSSWYDYNPVAHTLAPAAGTWLVRGATGTMYKLRIDSYYANPDGSEGSGDGGTFKIDVGAL